MPFITLPNDVRVEVFYMNQDQCDNYNVIERLGRYPGDNPITPGYYYEDMNGPFNSKQSAIESARVRYAEV